MAKTGVGARWESELSVHQDPKSGATVHQLTAYKGHSSHFYFTYPCWYDKGRKIVFTSDRETGRTCLALTWRAAKLPSSRILTLRREVSVV